MQQPDERCATSPNTASGRRHVEVSIRTGCAGYVFDLRKELPGPAALALEGWQQTLSAATAAIAQVSANTPCYFLVNQFRMTPLGSRS